MMICLEIRRSNRILSLLFTKGKMSQRSRAASILTTVPTAYTCGSRRRNSTSRQRESALQIQDGRSPWEAR